MNATVLYSLQTIISAGVFIFIYRLFVRNTNAYNWNRFYLLATMMISLFLPHINISGWFKSEEPVIYYGSLIDFDQAVTISPVSQIQNTFNLSDLIMTLYWLVAVFLLLRFGWGLMRILELAKNDDYQKSGNLRLYPIHRKTTFSFFNWIFIQPQHWEKPTIDYIVRHEQAHVSQMHSLDNLMTELILVFGWFNPFYYIYRRDLHLLHECQADQQVINSGCDATAYHQLLLNEVSGNLTYIIVNQFSYSLIKRRFKMISKNKQSRLAGFRILLAIPTAFALMMLFSFTSLEKTTNLLNNNVLQPTIHAVQSTMTNMQIPQQKPVVKDAAKAKYPDQLLLLKTAASINENYPGGYGAWSSFLKENFKYPEEEVNGGPQGTLYVTFVVEKNGEIKDRKIYSSIDAACDREALRVINLLPKQQPKIKDGNPISVQYILPINLNLLISNPQNTSVGNEDKPLLQVEQNPEFKGGYDAMQKFIRERISYPTLAQKSGIQGTVFVQFVVEKTGAISRVKILRGIGGGCDEEAVRIVKEMPAWIPGKQNGQEVAVIFQIPVKFQLKKTETSPIVATAAQDRPPYNREPVLDDNGNPVLLVVEQNPEFPGNYAGLTKYLRDNIQYPTLAKESGIQGVVFVQFIVDNTGNISRVKVLRGIGGGCDEEAVRIVKKMPKWIPGKQNGKPVSVMFQIPVKFQLSAKNNNQ